MNREDKISKLMEIFADKDYLTNQWLTIYHPVYPHHILQRANKVWWNMVINNLWTILFNIAWTPQENWSYTEIRGYDITKDFDHQSDETKITLWELIEKVLDNK